MGNISDHMLISRCEQRRRVPDPGHKHGQEQCEYNVVDNSSVEHFGLPAHTDEVFIDLTVSPWGG